MPAYGREVPGDPKQTFVELGRELRLEGGGMRTHKGKKKKEGPGVNLSEEAV